MKTNKRSLNFHCAGLDEKFNDTFYFRLNLIIDYDDKNFNPDYGSDDWHYFDRLHMSLLNQFMDHCELGWKENRLSHKYFLELSKSSTDDNLEIDLKAFLPAILDPTLEKNTDKYIRFGIYQNKKCLASGLIDHEPIKENTGKEFSYEWWRAMNYVAG